jgi:hypothetical protein
MKCKNKTKMKVFSLLLIVLLVFKLPIYSFGETVHAERQPSPMKALFDRYHYITADPWGDWYTDNYPGDVTIGYLTGPLTYDELKDYDIFVTYLSWRSSLGPRPTVSEVEALELFVRNGGGVLLMGDDLYGSGWDNEYCNILSEPYNVSFNNDQLLDPTNYDISVTRPEDDYERHIVFHNMAEHPVTAGVSNFWVHGTCSLVVNNPDAVEIVMGDDDTYSDRYAGYPKGSYPPALVALEHGSGRIIFAGDCSGLKHDVYDNWALLWNIFDWLAGTCPGSPLKTIHFEIHYYTEGNDIVNLTDNNHLTDSPGNITYETELIPGSNGVPDFVERVAISFEKAWTTYGNWGYPQGHSFSELYKVTIKNIDTEKLGGGYCQGLLGYSEIGISTALSEGIITDTWVRYMDMDENGLDDGGILQICAHEYFHAVQITMTPHWILPIGGIFFPKDDWIREGSACYMGYRVSREYYTDSDDTDSYFNYWNKRYLFEPEETIFMSERGYKSGLYWYFLNENKRTSFQGGGTTLVEKIWDIWSDPVNYPGQFRPSKNAITIALAEHGYEYTVEDTFKFFAKANYFWDQWYDIPPLVGYPWIHRIQKLHGQQGSLENYGVSYFKIIHNNPDEDNWIEITFHGDDDSDFFVYMYPEGDLEEELEMFEGVPVEIQEKVSNNTVIIVGRLGGGGDGSFRIRFSKLKQQANFGKTINQMLPLAQYNMNKAEELSVEAQDLLFQAQGQGSDTSSIEELIRKAEEFLALARENFTGGNYIAANVHALKAIEAYEEIIELLKDLLI